MNFEDNFIKRGVVDVSALRRKVVAQSEDDWNADAFRQKRFEVHRDTQTINLIFDRDFRHTNLTKHPKYAEFDSELTPVVQTVADAFGGEGQLVRCLLTRLNRGGVIPSHIDRGLSLELCHRLHIPVIASDGVTFVVGNEQVCMKEGEIWEINNMRLHSVRNGSPNARVHLIIDWAPPADATRHVHSPVSEAAAHPLPNEHQC